MVIPAWIKRPLRALGLALFGFVALRVLLSLGLPLEEWSRWTAQLISSGAGSVTTEGVMWVATGMFSVALLAVEFWFEPVGRLWRKLRPPAPYLSDRDSELTHAVLVMTLRSRWGKWFAAQHLKATGKEIELRYHMQTSAFQVLDAAMNGKIEIRGRQPGAVEYFPVTQATWRLVAFEVIPDKFAIWKLRVVPRHEVDPARVQRTLDCDSLIVDSRQFESVWPS